MIHRMGVRQRFISRTSILLFFRKTHLSDTHMMTEILIAITALLIGAVAGFAVRNTQARREQQQACEKARQEGNVEGRAMAEHLAMEQTAQLKTALAAAEKERDMTLKHAEENAADMQQRMSQQQQEAEKTLESTKREAAEMLENAKREAMENLQRTRADYEKRMETAKAEHAAMLDTLKENYEKRAKETAEQQEKHHREQMEMLKSEMLAATQRVLEQRSEQLKQDNNEQFSHNRKELENILNPLNDNLRNMREQVEKARTEQIEKMATLDSTIRTTLQHADNVKASADKLANALTNENKAQGNFGEIRLKTLLENMGFTEGKEFEEQYLIRDETGKPVTHDETGQKLIPDTIIHFPEGRDIIIDSKMSLKAYADFANAGNEEERRAALKRHVESVRRHVDELSEKKYYQYITGKRESVDFVVMFIPYDNMLEHALSADPALWQYAAQKNVLITGSHNLYMMLRIVLMSWDRQRQTQNIQQIIQEANVIVQRVQDFYTRMQDVEEKFRKTQEAFGKLNVTISPQGRGIITSAKKLIKFGAKEDEANIKTRKRLPSMEDEPILLEDHAENNEETENEE